MRTAKPVLHGRDHKPGGADPIGGGDGIKFDTTPQAGGYLLVNTTDGQTYEDTNGGDVLISSEGGSGGFIGITTGAGLVFIGSDETVIRIAEFGDFEVQNHNATATRLRITDEGYIIGRIGAGLKFEIQNAAGAAIFRVNEDGSMQGKTGQALTFDL